MSASLLRSALIAGVVLSGVGGAAYFGYDAYKKSGAASGVASVAAGEDPIVATVDGGEIRRSDLEKIYKNMARHIPQLASAPMDSLYDSLLDQAINQKLVAYKVRVENIAADDEFKAQLESIRQDLARDFWMKKAVDRRLTDERLRERYDEMVKGMPAEDEVRARHILVETEAEAKKLITKIKAGASFADLAKASSKDPASQGGGDLGYFTHSGVVPEFADAAFAMQKGGLSDKPVRTKFGWHVIQVEDRRPVQAPAFEDIADQIRGDLAGQTRGEVLGDLRKSVSIQVFNADGSVVEEPSVEGSADHEAKTSDAAASESKSEGASADAEVQSSDAGTP